METKKKNVFNVLQVFLPNDRICAVVKHVLQDISPTIIFHTTVVYRVCGEHLEIKSTRKIVKKVAKIARTGNIQRKKV